MGSGGAETSRRGPHARDNDEPEEDADRTGGPGADVDRAERLAVRLVTVAMPVISVCDRRRPAVRVLPDTIRPRRLMTRNVVRRAVRRRRAVRLVVRLGGRVAVGVLSVGHVSSCGAIVAEPPRGVPECRG